MVRLLVSRLVLSDLITVDHHYLPAYRDLHSYNPLIIIIGVQSTRKVNLNDQSQETITEDHTSSFPTLPFSFSPLALYDFSGARFINVHYSRCMDSVLRISRGSKYGVDIWKHSQDGKDFLSPKFKL